MSIYTNSNLSAARQFLDKGWSVIPLQGSRSREAPKAPALAAWKDYQHRLPTRQEVDIWFEQRQYDAIGIVLGSVSGVVVIDIDDPAKAEAFEKQMSDLTRTFTVTSGNRKLPHYYFQVPDDIQVPSRRGKGIELRGDGQYVVAPGMVMQNKQWTITNDVPLRILAQADINRLLKFFEQDHLSSHQSAGKTPVDASEAYAGADTTASSPLSQDGMVALYRKQARQFGRNEALFRVSCLARDSGWSQLQVQEVLTSIHVKQPPNSQHPTESAMQRHREAHGTIASAFSHPAQQRHRREHKRQLPNSVREKLLQLKLDRTARLLDGLLMAGFVGGDLVSARKVYEAVGSFGIGRNLVFQVLRSRLPGGHTVFSPVYHSSPRHPPTHANAANRCALITKQCLFGRDSKPGKIRGRKENVFRMPSIESLCQWLDVEDRSGDILQPEDLRSAAEYRASLHAALIRRAPGQYPRQWQAERLGVCKTSCRRYDRRRRIRVAPVFKSYPVSWHNIDRMLCDEPFYGTFLEDEAGKRYPALPSVGRRLLAQRRRIVLRWQDVNDYSAPAAEETSASTIAVPVTPCISDSAENRMSEVQRTSQLSRNPQPVSVKTGGVLPTRSGLQSLSAVCPQPLKLVDQARFARTVPLTKPDARRVDALVDSLYNMVRGINPEKSVTRSYARSLVKTYGVELVERGMHVMTNRKKIENPGGFLTMWLRCEKPDAKLRTSSRRRSSRPDHAAASKRQVEKSGSPPASQMSSNLDWVDRLKASPYARYFENVEDLLG